VKYEPIDIPLTRTIGYCIFCGGVAATDDHIIPLALGGRHILRKSSCEPCRDKFNTSVDQPVLRGVLHSARLAYGVPRSKKRKPQETFRIMLLPEEGGVAEVLSLPFANLPKYLMIPIFEGPAILKGEILVEEGIYKIDRTFVHNKDGNFAVQGREGGSLLWKIDDYVLLMRMLAKAAHSLAYLHFDSGSFIPLMGDLLEGLQHPSYLCGCLDIFHNRNNTNKYYDVRLGYLGNYLVASLQIFSNIEMPYIDFIVGMRRGFAVFR